MRIVFLLALAALGCAGGGPLIGHNQPEVPPVRLVQIPPEVPVEPQRVAVTDQRRAYQLVLRALVGEAFRVTFSDADSGTIAAETEQIDRERTLQLQQQREQIWESLTGNQQVLVVRQGRDREFRGAVTIRRRLSISVAIGPRVATVTPKVVSCAEVQGDPPRCGSWTNSLRNSEIKLVSEIIGDIEVADLPDKSSR